MSKRAERLIKRAGFQPQEERRLLKIIKNPNVASYPVRFTGHIIRRAKKDPRLWRIYLPSLEEINASGETANNYGEKENTVLPGLQHKYRPTALISVTNECAANCRHCFRRNTARASQNIADEQDFQKVVEYVRNHPEINNVLISGGDPLMLRRAYLKELIQMFSAIDHIRWLRIGTKVPVNNPDKVSGRLISLFQRSEKPIIIVTHANLPVEVDKETIEAIGRIQRAGITVLNQHAVLKGVNDEAETLFELYMRLSEIGVVNMYTFHHMPVFGAAHLQTPFLSTFLAIEEAKGMLPGPAKTFRYILPLRQGKMEVLGFDDQENPTKMYLRYHESKDPALHGKIVEVGVSKETVWVEL